MTSAERSFQESLRSFNATAGRLATPNQGRKGGVTILDMGSPMNSSPSGGGGGSSFSSFFSSATPGQRGQVQADSEVQESLLGSFQARAQGVISSVGLGPRNSDSEFCGLTTFQRYFGFALTMGTAMLCFMISLFTLPMILISSGKFALTYTMGSLLFMFSFSLLNGLMAHAKHIFSWDRLPFTASYIGSMMLTLFFAVVIVCLAWYIGSYLPGGTQSLRWMTRSTIGLPI
ncbi:hypothetical protein BASA50_004456 [Batrachochytrium salamandrivorans]|uniref:Protein transport protein SFT2 n=1 Tax=Batrachochytrium salamandrivorans TaxID=1357716 RepID=A0ABQ8FFU7_9FUNG|nr:hypothetical protein BASA60_002507 [Batrachochytrium salamandrivorans]KAH6588153.1 hypothetical protein BASA61_006058 [Batrachochytrium salamandrivorans]KAH6597539.1 hypothetical protein BASA50_004456 [Batrachochytrium salamandrivorans]KAH9265707.1 hypothetical protein BASA83_010995 [Batrachochytrium salamandrivorans]